MRQIIFALALLWSIAAKGQATLQYRLCDNCPTGENTSNINTTYTYPVMTPYTSAGVTSDFGARYRKPNYDWHKGVDFKPHGCASGDGCRGTAVVTLGAGTVEAIYALHGMKMIAIAGANGNHYGYGHIFNARFIGANSNHTFINEGKFLIKNLDEFPNQKVYAIVDLTTYQAFGPTEGTVTIDVGNNPLSIYVRPIINENQDIAPMGGSGNSFYNGTGSENDPLPVHLHLYQFRDINKVRLVEETHETNCMNPLQNVTHQSPAIQVKWQTEGQNNTWNSPIINPNGTLPTRFRVRPLMLNVTDPSGGNVPETGSSGIYGNVVSNINKVEIEIKKSTENNYFRYSGKDYSGFINLGGTIHAFMYPIELTTDKRYGKWNRQGIEAFAYASSGGHPYDDYYFEGFYSRLQKSLGTGRLTDLPNAAKYTDDVYELRAKTTNVSGIESFSNIHTFKLDNFKPYIESYDIKLCSQPIHKLRRVGFQGKDKVLNDGYVMNTKSNTPFPSNTFCFPKFIEFTVNTSEIMKNLQFKHKEFSSSQFSSSILMTQDESNKLIWRGSFSISAVLASPFKYSIELSGTDMSDNQILNVYSNTASNSISSKFLIPTRLSATTWSNFSINEGTDQIDFWIINCGDRLLAGKTGNRNTEEVCQILSEVESLVDYNSCKDASIRLSGLGNNPNNYRITWSDYEGNILTEYNDHNEISIVKTGTYCYKVEAIDDCCNTEGCVEVFQSEMQNKLEIAETVTYSACGESATIFITDVGELGNSNNNIKYLWSTGSTFKGISVPAGTYTVTVTVNNPTMYEYGCTNTKEFTVEDRALKISATTEPICPDEIGSIFPYITGGTEPYNFQWSNGETTEDITDLIVDWYYLTVSDANGCTSEQEFEIGLIDKIVAISHFENLQNCDVPDGKIIIKNILDEDIIYQWYDSYGVLISTNKDITNLKTGEYTLVAKSNSGCTTELKQSICCCKPGINTGDPGACYIGYNKDLVVTGTVTHTSNGENNGSVFLVVQGGKGQYIFTWTGPDGYSSSEKDITNLAQGEYTVTVSDGCMMITKTFIINDGLICKQANIIITGKTTCIFPGVQPGVIDISVSGGSPPYTYQWSTDGSTNQDYSSYYDGSTVTVTDKNGCVAKKDFQLEKATPLNVDFEISNPDGCNEWVNDVVLKIKINSGNPPYKIHLDGSTQTITTNNFEIKIGTSNNYWTSIKPYIKITDACQQEKFFSKETSCLSFCPDDCIKITLLNVGNGGCVKTYRGAVFGYLFYSKFKVESTCPDNVERKIYNFIENEYVTFKGKGSYTFERLFQPGFYPFIITNEKTGCQKEVTFNASQECSNVIKWFFENGGSVNTTGYSGCTSADWYTVEINSDMSDPSNLICERVDKCDKTGATKVIKSNIKKCDVFDSKTDLFATVQFCDLSCDYLPLGDVHSSPKNPKCPDCIVFAHNPDIGVNRILPPDCNDEINELIYSKSIDSYILFWPTSLDSIKKINGFSFKNSTLSTDFNGFTRFLTENEIKFIRHDKQNNIYIISKINDKNLFQKKDILGKEIWNIHLPDGDVMSISDNDSGNYEILYFDPTEASHYSLKVSSEGLFTHIEELPLNQETYNLIHQSGNTTIALNGNSNKLTFATYSGSFFKNVPSAISVKDIKTIANGNIVVLGEFVGEVRVGNNRYNSEGYQNAILLTYDLAGNLLSSKAIQNHRDEYVKGLATKGNEEVAYHGKYNKMIYYAPNPADNVIDSCIFVNIISLTDTSCTLLPPVLSLDETACKLTLSSTEPEVIYTLHEEVDGVWQQVNGAVFPYQPEANGRYRASAKKEGCTTAFSDITEVNCLKKPLPCDIALLDLTYDTLADKFAWYWGETKFGLDSIFGNTIDKTLITSTITTFVKYQISYTWVKHIRYDMLGNIYIFGTDGTTKSFVTTVTTSGVTTTTWYQDVILQDIIWRPVLYQYSLLMYDKILNQYTHQIRRLTGQLISTENLGDFQSGKFTFELLQYHKTGYYTNIEYSSAQTSIRWYMGPTIYLTNLPPAVRIKRIQKWSQDRWMVSTEYTGTIIINGTTYTSLGYNTVMFIWYDGQGNVIKVTEIKHSRDEFISHVSTDGIKKVAYTGTYRDTIYNNTYPNGYMIEECAFMDGFDVEFNTPAPIVVPTLSKTDRVPKSSQEFRFYPNPFSKGINLDITSDIAEEVNIETYNMVGALMFTTKLDLQQGQNVRYMDAFERIPAGVYMVKIKSPTREHMTRVIRIE